MQIGGDGKVMNKKSSVGPVAAAASAPANAAGGAVKAPIAPQGRGGIAHSEAAAVNDPKSCTIQ